jgi:predicted 3-demethylubiquinone-9 3-methyltransferase (glyoxalase superfamily)
MHNLYPCLWFKNQAAQAAEFYCSVFTHSRIISQNPIAIIFELNQTRFMALNGADKEIFNAANSYVISCDTQAEIDHFWEKLSEGGSEGKCGWLTDKYGVSWQVVPSILGKLMNNPEKAPKAMYVFMQMSKFEISKLENL